jgi:hypothetical protein
VELFNATYDFDAKLLTGTHFAGFYSCINCTRISLYKLISQGITPEKISLANTLPAYKEYYNQDLYPVLYQKNLKKIDKIKQKNNFEIFCPTITKHIDMDFEFFKSVEDVFFYPSNNVLVRVGDFLKKYNIDLNNTLAVLHRGNDKWKEAKILSPKKWIEIIDSKLNDQRILLQTDEQEFRDVLKGYYKDRCFIIGEMLFGSDKENNIRPYFNKTQWAIDFESVIRIISKCKTIINHTGNCAFVPIAYRGTTKGEVQLFNEEVYDFV